MKTKFMWVVLLSHVCVSASAGSGDENELLFEFKKQVSCEMVKRELSGHKIEIECNRRDSKKKRFFGGRYLGKKSVNLKISELKKNSLIKSITQNNLAVGEL